MVTRKRYHRRNRAQNRARIRAFFAEGVNKLHLPLVVRALPALLHSALFLFFVGLVVFLYHSDLLAFKFVAVWVGICTLLYVCVTFLPIFRHDSPYNTPLSPLAWFLYTGFLCLFFQSLRWITAFNCFRRELWVRSRSLGDLYHDWFLHGMDKAAEDSALGLSSDIDIRALLWAFETLDEDDEIEGFFEGILGSCNSAIGSDPQIAFKTPNGERMSEALVGFMCSTLSSNLVPESVKRRRVEICRRMVEAASLSIDRWIFDRILYKDWGGLLNSVDFGLFLRGITYGDAFSAYYSQCVTSVIVATVQERDDRWFELAMDQLDVSKAILREYLDHGDSLLLANCIAICRRTMGAYSEHGWNRDVYSQSKTLKLLAKLDIRHTLPELQYEFCSLWNELVGSARYTGGDRHTRSLSINILMHIRKMYIILHESTSAAPTQFSALTTDINPILTLPSSYPLCNNPFHSSCLSHDKIAIAATGLKVHNSETSASTLLINGVPGTCASGSIPGTPPVLTTNPSHIGIYVADDSSPEHVRS